MRCLPRRHLAAQRGRARQRGVVAVVFGLSLAVMLGFIGLALDGGRLYLTKTELQNAADACALASSFELAGAPGIPAAAFDRAQAAGQTVGGRNKVDFQGAAIAFDSISVRFGTTLGSGSAWVGAAAASPDSKYVRCTLSRSGITPWFMQVLGLGDQTVRALATASLLPAQDASSAIVGSAIGTGPMVPALVQ